MGSCPTPSKLSPPSSQTRPFQPPTESHKSVKGRWMTESGIHTDSWLSCSHNTQSAGYPPPNRLFSPTWIWIRLIELREESLERRGRWSVGTRGQCDIRVWSETPKIPKSSIVFRDGNAVSDRSVSMNPIGCHGLCLSIRSSSENGRTD